ncbi:sulfite reductase [Skermanella stibiiresistens SB22]|uniref:Sulfite reductase n=1 Tax=Skermanella stibiiresistens SB22 TaxID=1385369 RepID=W9H8I8_9PROT|nr:NADPH-dependent assimilatory sulfite reductase hemoprotein subunit [Skermanella stibiiresistens]EWY42570.1 sulfite reductase [Skermanella stibiiresistens SB22]
MSQSPELPKAKVPAAPKLAHVEDVKQESALLRGSIAETLNSDLVKFTEDEYNLLKFHGTYQGYDRDSATELKQAKAEKKWEFMVRARIPAGRLTAQQYLDLDDLAGRRANHTLRITTRQAIQFHGVVKSDLKGAIADINQTMITTLGACGDVVRNVTSLPAPVRSPINERLAADAKRISDHLLPHTRAYHEIWLDGEKVLGEPEVEPIYGTTYLPRKFKIGLGVPEDNSVDVLTNDLGIVALFDGDTLTGYNLAVGGGLGMTHNKPKTYPRLASFVAFVEPDDLIKAVEAVVIVQRDHGDRTNRRHARLKYTIDDRGLPWFKSEMDRVFGRVLEDPRPMPPFQVADHLGWHEQGDGLWYLGLPVPSGRIQDTDTVKLRTALHDVVGRFQPALVLMPTQDLILADVKDADRAEIERTLRAAGVQFPEELLPVHRWSLACPALPTCGLALTEAERIRTPMIDSIAEVMARYGLAQERLSIRITGCPNGCARPYAGDIGLVGRMPGHFSLYVGGDFECTRLNWKLLDRVPEDDVPETLAPLFAEFAAQRDQGEGFGDFLNRLGLERATALVKPDAPVSQGDASALVEAD